jgi:hypothetical protein
MHQKEMILIDIVVLREGMQWSSFLFLKPL